MTMPATEADRIRGYLIAQANKLTIPELVEKVRTDSATVRDAGASVPAARFAERPAEGEWSVAEVWTHILQMSEHGAASISAILDGRPLPPRADDVISGETKAGLADSEAYWQAFAVNREPLYERVLKATGEEHLDVKITHAMFGDFSWREWFLFMRVHDLDHMRQFQAIAAALA